MELDLKKLSKILMVGGLAVMIGAFGWWYSFYSSIANELTELMKLSKKLVELRKKLVQLNPGLGQELAIPSGDRFSVFDAISCLYSSGGSCGLLSGLGQLRGRTPYEPMVFWLGLTAVVAGAAIWAAAKPADAKK